MRRQLVSVSLGFRRLFLLSATPSTRRRASAFVSCRFHEPTWGSNPDVGIDLLASNTTDPEYDEAHFSCSISVATQTQTLFFSVAVSLASGCSMAYDQGGILPVEINPQIESSLARRWRAE